MTKAEKLIKAQELRDSWYELSYWEERLGSPAIELIESQDESASYEMDRAHIFKLMNGKFAYITESGCSCYSSDQADIQIFDSIKPAAKLMTEWKKENKGRYGR